MPRFGSVWPRLGIWALLLLGILITAPAAQAALVGYDIVFTCETRCSVIGDEPTGMLFFDDSALLTDGWKQLGDIGGSLMVTVGTEEFTEADDYRTGFPALKVTAGTPESIDFFGIGTGPPWIEMGSEPAEWMYVLPDGRTSALGSYVITPKAGAPVPEPHAALLFSVGSLVVASRIRRRPRR